MTERTLPRLSIETGSKHPKRMYNTRIPLAIINVLPQPRKTFKDIDRLGNSIAAKNIRNELQVGRYGAKHCQMYLDEINELWTTDFRLDDLICVVEEGIKVYYVLIDGERRYRACVYLRDTGCDKCQKRQDGNCYTHHFGDLKVDVRISENISPDDAIDIQAQTNIHHRVPPYEEAEFYDRLFKRRKARDQNYSIGEFAYDMGRSTDTIRQAIKFCELPPEFQKYVSEGKIQWGAALVIVELRSYGRECQGNGVQRIPLSDKELEFWIIRSIVGKMKVQEFRELVKNFLQIRESGQTSMMDVFGDEQKKEMEKHAVRLIVERHTIAALWGYIHYFVRVYSLFQDGKLGKENSPFSVRSPVKIFRAVIEKERQLLPCISRHLPKAARQQAEETISEAEKLLARVEEIVPETIN